MSYQPIPPVGQDDMAGSLPVVIASDQSAVPVSLASVPSHAVTNAGTFVVQVDGAALTSLQLIDDGIATVASAITSKGMAAVGTDGTNARILKTDASGELQVDVLTMPTITVNAHAVTNAGTFAVQVDGAALTSLQLIDDVVYTDDTSTHATGTTKGAGIMAVANPTDAAVDANDIGMVAMTLARALKNDITTIAGTAPTTAGFIDIKGADGNVFVRQATASNLNMTEASAASILTSVQLIDDMIYTDDTSTHATGTSKGALMMAAATPTDTAVNANDIGALAMTVNRELMVSLTTALPAGSAAIGKLAANAGVTIGAVEIAASQTLSTVTTVGTVTTLTGTTTLTPGTGATNLGKAVDAAPGATDTGVMALAVRDDTLNIRSGTEGDYEPLHTDANGALWVKDVNSASALTSLQLIDDTVFADDAAFTVAVSKVTAIGLMADETSTDSVDEGDIGIPRMTLDRKQISVVYAHGAGGMSVATGSIAATKTDIGTANTAGSVYGWYIYNPNASVAYVQFFNTQASGVTLGTTAPVYSLGIPATSGANVMNNIPINHSTAISIAVTTTRAGSTGTGSTVDYNIFYKQ